MTKDLMLPKENFPKVEEIRELNTEVPSYEEFMRNYKSDKAVEESYLSEINACGDLGFERGYGPCYKCGRDWISFELEIVLENARGGRSKRTVYDIVDAFKAASEIEKREGFWDNGNPSFSSRERKTLVDRIISVIDEHVSNNRSINRTVSNDIDDDDCVIL